MLSNRPYLLRAFYDWIVDSACTPIIVLDTEHPRCAVPEGYSENGEIVLNISPSAIRDLKISNHSVEFKASFSGAGYSIYAPIAAVLAVYAEENGEGLFFEAEQGEEESSSSTGLRSIEGNIASHPEGSKPKPGNKVNRQRPILTVVE